MEQLLNNIISGKKKISININFNINYIFKKSSDLNDDSCILIKKVDQNYYKYNISKSQYVNNIYSNLNKRLFLQKLYLNNKKHDKFINLNDIKDIREIFHNELYNNIFNIHDYKCCNCICLVLQFESTLDQLYNKLYSLKKSIDNVSIMLPKFIIRIYLEQLFFKNLYELNLTLGKDKYKLDLLEKIKNLLINNIKNKKSDKEKYIKV